ncbi:MAG TPA: CvpA family protein [Patescibacteria group bacterium]
MFGNLNWVDFVVIAVIAFYALEGYAIGGISAFFDFLKFVTSFLAALKLYGLVGQLLFHFFSLPQGISNAIGFFVVAFLVEIILQISLAGIFVKILNKSLFKKPEWKKWDNFVGIIPGVFSGLVLLMFLFTVIVSLPVSPFLKDSITGGKISGILVERSTSLEKQFNNIFGGAANETINFLTVEPDSNSSVRLNFTYKNGTVDTSAEEQMLTMVNNERTSRGLSPLVMNEGLRDLARAHARDMLERGYFSHYTPEGLTPFDRMDKAGISYTAAGENLAFSPNVTLAMQGLMQSPGHRANILSKDFGKVGIGVISAGIFGEMFVQEFTD